VSPETLNFDPEEQSQFDAISATWWDPEGHFRPLHDLNPARLKFVTERCSLSESVVLDVGCGGGILSESMARAGGLVTGLDIASKALSVARLHLHETGLEVDYRDELVESYADDHPGTVDILTCMEMLEHVPDPASVIKAAYKVLKPGGHCFFSTLNRTPRAFMLGIVGAEYVARLLPAGTHKYDQFIRPSELSGWIREAGLELNEICGMHYNPLTRTVRLGGSVAVNYLVHGHKPHDHLNSGT
jgi:2-polyprenyl-6-hydroxyphenyl methylase/3-demethylubiquinone-9 3-methyltransferase